MAKPAQPRASTHSVLRGHRSSSLRGAGAALLPSHPVRPTAHPSLGFCPSSPGLLQWLPQLNFHFPSLSAWVILIRLSNPLLSLHCFQIKTNFSLSPSYLEKERWLSSISIIHCTLPFCRPQPKQACLPLCFPTTPWLLPLPAFALGALLEHHLYSPLSVQIPARLHISIQETIPNHFTPSGFHSTFIQLHTTPNSLSPPLFFPLSWA